MIWLDSCIQRSTNLRSYSMPIRFVLLLFSVLTLQHTSAQVSADATRLDYGVIVKGSDRVLDVHFTNLDAKETMVLTSNVSRECAIRWSSKRIAPDSTITLRIKINPLKTGAFKEDVEVYFASMQKPIVLKLRADVDYVDRTDSPNCPDFRQRPEDCCDDEPTLIHVINARTGDPIRGARVRIIENGRVQRDVATNRSGNYEEQIPVGYYFVMAEAENYSSADTAGYINRRNNYIELALTPGEMDILAEDIDNSPIPETTTEPVAVVEEEEEEEDDRDEIVIVPAEPIEVEEEKPEPVLPEPVVVTSTILPEDQYTRNSIVFLVDVSQSMANKGKMDLLKASMLSLVEVLRPTDQVAFLTYASDAAVVLDMTSGDRKEALEKAIQELEAGGMTAGLIGFKGAFKMAKEHFIEGGNNQLIVATDGAFRNADRPKLVKMVDKNQRKGVKTSVIGIRSTEFAGRTLTEIANEGSGSFIFVDDYDAGKEALIREVQKQSYIGD